MPINKPDLDVDLNYRQLADRYDFKELHAMHDEYLRLMDLILRRKHKPREAKRLRMTIDMYRRAIEHKEAEGR